MESFIRTRELRCEMSEKPRSVHHSSKNLVKMVKKSETTSQQRHKVVILREIGYSWEKIRKTWYLPLDLQPNQYTEIILQLAAWRVRNGVEDLENQIIGANVTLTGSKNNKSCAENIPTIFNSLSQKKQFARR